MKGFIGARQTTLASEISLTGTGVHSGAPVSISLCPADGDTGIRFVLSNGHPEGTEIIADQRSVTGTGADRGRAKAGFAPAHAFYLGGAVVLWVGWLAALGIGAVAGATVPPGLHLELLVPLYLVGQIVPELRRRETRRAVVGARRSRARRACPVRWRARSSSTWPSNTSATIPASLRQWRGARRSASRAD